MFTNHKDLSVQTSLPLNELIPIKIVTNEIRITLLSLKMEGINVVAIYMNCEKKR